MVLLRQLIETSKVSDPEGHSTAFTSATHAPGASSSRAGRPTKLHLLLGQQEQWDEQTWFQTQRYLIDNLSRPGLFELVDLAGCERVDAARFFKTDAVKLLLRVPPRVVLAAWDLSRTRR